MKEYFKNIKDKKFLISIFVFLGGQSILYALIKHFQFDYNTFNFAIDSKIPLIPPFIIIYNMFYPFLFFTFYYLYKKDSKTYDKAIIAGTLGYIICNIIFLCYPVEMIRPDLSDINTDRLSFFILNLTYKLDQPAINCFPSIHCLFCFQTIYSVIKSDKIPIKNKTIITLLSITIILSIFFVKQHYVFDMIAAAVVALICNIFVSLIYEKIKKNN